MFVSNTLIVLVGFQEYVGLNDWPDECARELMESAELGWTPSEKTDFVTHVRVTHVHFQLFGFEMSRGFRMAVPILFFGWWLYMTELRQFHSFDGFPFDQVCYNATGSGGGGHHH